MAVLNQRINGAALRRMAKFAIVGAINTGIDVGVFSLLYFWAELPVLVANTLGYSVAVANSFLMNKYWTFSESRNHGQLHHQFAKFLVLNLVGLGISNAVVWLLEGVIHVLAAKGMAVVATFVWNYWTSRRFVYTSQ
ncbi:MAG: GtrA family protein [Minwuiales bacterium]|nr:GtrA family protein [Minwuiales bacterium]